MILNRLRAWANRNHIAEFHHRQSLTYLQTSRHILDIGCGNGLFTQIAGERVVALDYNLETLLAHTGTVKNVAGSALALPFADQRFDAVHCSHLIEHFRPADAHRLLSEMARVLRVDGIMVLAAPMMWPHFYDDFTHVRPYPPRAVMRYLAGQAGSQRTLATLPFAFEQIALDWRRRPLYLPTYRVNKFTQIVGLASSLVYRWHIWRPAVNGYCLVARRVR